jgi:hypothetical protein
MNHLFSPAHLLSAQVSNLRFTAPLGAEKEVAWFTDGACPR